MKLTLKELLTVTPIINSLMTKTELSPKVFYWLTYTKRKMVGPLEDYDAARLRLLADVGAKENKKTNRFEFEGDQEEVFASKIDVVLDEDAETEFKPIAFKTLIEDKKLGITPQQVFILDKLVELTDDELEKLMEANDDPGKNS